LCLIIHQIGFINLKITYILISSFDQLSKYQSSVESLLIFIQTLPLKYLHISNTLALTSKPYASLTLIVTIHILISYHSATYQYNSYFTSSSIFFYVDLFYYFIILFYHPCQLHHIHICICYSSILMYSLTNSLYFSKSFRTLIFSLLASYPVQHI
jgi:hypothetical protein